MILLLFFDIPTTTSKNKKDAYKFKKHLINDGYIMIQYSIYARVTKNYALLEKHISRLKRVIPKNGSIKILPISSNNFKNIIELNPNIKDIKIIDKCRDIVYL